MQALKICGFAACMNNIRAEGRISRDEVFAAIRSPSLPTK
jgi:hypothetical protein